jgi:hypothetical protein
LDLKIGFAGVVDTITLPGADPRQLRQHPSQGEEGADRAYRAGAGAAPVGERATGYTPPTIITPCTRALILPVELDLGVYDFFALCARLIAWTTAGRWLSAAHPAASRPV